MHLKLYNKKFTDSKSNMAEPRDHSDHLGQFYESSLGCMPTDYFRKRQQQPP